MIAVLLVAAYAALFQAQKRPAHGVPILLFGLIAGATLTIKPLLLPLYVALLFLFARSARNTGMDARKQAGLGVAGLAAPGAGVLLWLWFKGALPAFSSTITTLIPYHARLGRKPFSYLLTHSMAGIMPLVAAWLILLLWRRRRPSLEHLELVLGAAFALIAYAVQGKGYPYQRYPLLALLLLLISMEIMHALCAESEGGRKAVASVALAYACLAMAPLAVWRVRSFRGDQPFKEALARDLARLQTSRAADVQCLDTFGGCINTLYDLRLVQSTGFLYDCYLFTPGHDAAAEVYRLRFWEAYQRTQPRLLVLTSQYCFGPDTFGKVDHWPLLRDEIGHAYVQAASWQPTHPQHWWSRQEWPPGYRIYMRK